MNKTFKIVRWQLWGTKNSLIIFYSILIAIVILFVLLNNSGILVFGGNDDKGNTGEFNGLGIASMIFLFIAGLNYFKEDFKFLQANNISRFMQYKTTIISFLILTASMALISMIGAVIINNFIPYDTLFETIYTDTNVFSAYLWTFSLYFYAISMGWFITLLYYRSGKMMRVFISLVPAIVIAIMVMSDRFTNATSTESLIKIFNRIMGLTDGNSHLSVISLLVMSVICLAFSYLLVRKAPLKE